MKKLTFITAFISFSLLTLNAKSQATTVSYDVFYNQLSPHGKWLNYQGYGSVWQPYPFPGFRPYETNGHWVATESGWGLGIGL